MELEFLSTLIPCPVHKEELSFFQGKATILYVKNSNTLSLAHARVKRVKTEYISVAKVESLRGRYSHNRITITFDSGKKLRSCQYLAFAQGWQCEEANWGSYNTSEEFESNMFCEIIEHIGMKDLLYVQI